MKISELTPTEVLNDEDIFPVVQDGETKNVKRKDLLKNLPTPTEDGDAVNREYVKKQIMGLKISVDEELQELKNVVNGVTLTYEGLTKPTINKSNPTSNGIPSYTSNFSFHIPYFAHKYDTETGEAEITLKRTNLPPYTYEFSTDGRVSMNYACEFSNELLVLDESKINPAITEFTPMSMSLAEIISLVEELGGTATFHRNLNGASAGSNLTMTYSFNATFPDEDTREAFYSEYLTLLNISWTGMFVENYTPITTPEALTSEVIENA